MEYFECAIFVSLEFMIQNKHQRCADVSGCFKLSKRHQATNARIIAFRGPHRQESCKSSKHILITSQEDSIGEAFRNSSRLFVAICRKYDSSLAFYDSHGNIHFMVASRKTAAIKVDREPARGEKFPAQNHDERGDFSIPISEACQKAISMFAFAIEDFSIFLGRSSRARRRN